ncbi:MAG TPA: hypothetical protein VG826_18570 [Pirellulales bacterium]|nr:hypothetical protein [Pirellulales bacterium]
MRFAISACFAVALLAGNTGCCGPIFCRPLFPLLHRHCCSDDCGGMGCQRANIFNWSRCCDTCDHCGDWTGQGIIARTQGSEQAYTAGRYRGRPTMSSRVVPGTYRETTRMQPSDAQVADEEVIEEEPAQLAEAPRVKRVRSYKPRSRNQLVRAEQVD